MTSRRQRLVRPLQAFLRTESAGGGVLVAAALLALVCANSPWGASYTQWWEQQLGAGSLRFTLKDWVNDGGMTLFFLVVGLEIKRELVNGELADRRSAALPAIAALGGMVVPVAVFLVFTAGSPESHAWGIPMATDIALAVGVLGILGTRVPSGARLFLLALAIVDDIGAILVIAIAYSEGVQWLPLVAGAAVVAVVVACRRGNVQWLGLYVALGAMLWWFLHAAHVHATLAGVIMGLLAPVEFSRGNEPLIGWLERRLHPISSFVVVPLFALANTGIPFSLSGVGSVMTTSLGLGVVFGLVAGKLVGVAGATMVAVRLGFGPLPDGVTTRIVVGLGGLAGIGFTVSLLVSELAIADPNQLDKAKLAVLVASMVAALVGVALLSRSTESSNTQ